MLGSTIKGYRWTDILFFAKRCAFSIRSLIVRVSKLLQKKQVSDILDIVHTCIGLCQRNSPRMDFDESESLRFRLLDSRMSPWMMMMAEWMAVWMMVAVKWMMRKMMAWMMRMTMMVATWMMRMIMMAAWMMMMMAAWVVTRIRIPMMIAI